MNSHVNEQPSRRDLVRSAARWAALGGLGALGGALLARPRTPRRADDCAAPEACRDCRLLPRCARPEAESAKRAAQKR